jgi:hypothetical protein
MRFQFHYIAIVLTFLTVSVAQPNSCENLPSNAKLSLEQRFPEWRRNVLSDLSGYDRKLGLESHATDCLGIAKGHFEQPDHMAYAVLLLPKSGHVATSWALANAMVRNANFTLRF